MGISWQELLVVALIILLIFGAKRVPEIFRSMGSGVNEFKKGLREGSEESPTDNASEKKQANTSERSKES